MRNCECLRRAPRQRSDRHADRSARCSRKFPVRRGRAAGSIVSSRSDRRRIGSPPSVRVTAGGGRQRGFRRNHGARLEPLQSLRARASIATATWACPARMKACSSSRKLARDSERDASLRIWSKRSSCPINRANSASGSAGRAPAPCDGYGSSYRGDRTLVSSAILTLPPVMGSARPPSGVRRSEFRRVQWHRARSPHLLWSLDPEQFQPRGQHGHDALNQSEARHSDCGII